MNVDTMRKIDYFVGVPICFVLSLLKKLTAPLLFFYKPKKINKNVLLIELSEMGSAILVDPAMRKLISWNYSVFFVIFKKNKVSLSLLNTIKEDNIFTIREKSFLLFIYDTLRFLIWCHKKKIATCIDLELFSRFTAILSELSGAKNKVGFYKFHNEGLYRGNFLTHKVAYNPYMHISKNFMSLIYAFHENKKELPLYKNIINDESIKITTINIPEENKIKIKRKIKKYFPEFSKQDIILVNANASNLLPQRRWPLENYIELIKTILKNHKNKIILLTGSPEEFEELQKITSAVNNSYCINFAGALEFNELTALYSIAKIMISNDSGPPHFASVTNLHTFVFFGPETPNLYGSLGNSTYLYANFACSPCVNAWNHRKTPCNDNKCLQFLNPNIVYKKINNYI